MNTAVYRTAIEVNDAMLRVYNYMFLAIVISGLVSYFVGTSPDLLQFFFTGWIKWVVMFAPLAAVIGIGFALATNPPKELALLMLGGFSAVMGLSFAVIFAVFTMGSIVMAFMSAAVLFGTMSLYGYFTRRDLTSIGQFFQCLKWKLLCCRLWRCNAYRTICFSIPNYRTKPFAMKMVHIRYTFFITNHRKIIICI